MTGSLEGMVPHFIMVGQFLSAFIGCCLGQIRSKCGESSTLSRADIEIWYQTSHWFNRELQDSFRKRRLLVVVNGGGSVLCGRAKRNEPQR